MKRFLFSCLSFCVAAVWIAESADFVTSGLDLSSPIVFGGNVTFNGTFITTSSGTSAFLNAPIVMNSSKPIGWSGTTDNTADVILLRDGAANTLAQRNGTNAQTFRVYRTYTDGSNGRWISLEDQVVAWRGNGTGNDGSIFYFANKLTNGGVTFQTNSTDRWAISGSSGHLLASADNTYGVGGTSLAATGARPLFINVGTSGLAFDRTNTAGGTTGAQTINKSAGSVNFAAAASSLVVTNSLVTATSNIIATVQTNDGTLKTVLAVPAAGSFTLFGNAAATAETRVAFLVTN